MSYAIIINYKYKKKSLTGIYKHNERKNDNYKNKLINKERTKYNYSIKEPYNTYEKMFYDIREKYNLKGQIKDVSNVICQYIISASPEYFMSASKEEIRRYFESAYKFAASYHNLGEQYILSAIIHMDETTPHMHLIYIPVVHTKDKKGKDIDKIACSEYWKGKNSYNKLQDNFHKYITKCGFNLERGKSRGVEHLSSEKFKQVTNYDNIKYELENDDEIEVIQDVDKKNLPMIVEQNKSLVLYTKKLKSYLAKSMIAIEKVVELKNENNDLHQENRMLQGEINRLKEYIDNTFEFVSILFDFSKERLHRLVDDFCDRLFKGR